jgi:DNA mismatch repair ATPase MutL
MSQETCRLQPLVRPARVYVGEAEVAAALEHSDALRRHGFNVSAPGAPRPNARARAAASAPTAAGADDDVVVVDTPSTAQQQHPPEQQQQQSEGETGTIDVWSVPLLPYDRVGPQDVQTLTAQLALYNGTIVAPLRQVWHSMATLACRHSIMIGSALDQRQMEKVLRGLGELDHPWCCPHGRPTVRHVATLERTAALALEAAVTSRAQTQTHTASSPSAFYAVTQPRLGRFIRRENERRRAREE